MKILLSFISLILLLAIFNSQGFGQASEVWTSFYNSPISNEDRGNSMIMDNAGNIYVTGQSKTQSNGFDIVTVKYNSMGVEQWSQSYNTSNNENDIGVSIGVDQQGNVYVSGISLDRLITIKYNSQGVEQWVKSYSDVVDCRNLVMDAQGNVYVSGTLGDVLDYYYLIVKYNPQGIQQWEAIYNENNIRGYTAALAIDPFGNTYITGQGNGVGPASNCITVKYNSSGVKQWAAVYNGPSNLYDWGYSIVADSNYIYVGGSSSDSQTDQDLITLKYNLQGVQQWASRYNRSGNSKENAYSIAKDKAGNVFTAGKTVLTGDDYLTVKYNSTGQFQWAAIYNGPGNNSDLLTHIKVDQYGRSYVTGTSRGSGTGNDIATVKYSPAGVEEWVMRYTSAGNINDAGNFLCLDDVGNVYAGGSSARPGTNFDYITIKYSQITNIIGISSEQPAGFHLSQNYPNPFNPETKIKFDIPVKSFVNVKIFDISGKKISELVHQSMNSGSYEVSWDASEYHSGVYYYRLEAGDFSETKKMILVK